MLDFDVNELCYGCEACKNICPKQAIVMKKSYDGFLYPNIDKDLCIGCRKCDEVCLVLNKKVSEKKFRDRKAFAVYNLDDSIRKESSSGGLFTTIANYVIQRKGAVFGVVVSDNMEIIHTETESIDGIEAMRGSKYAQSRIDYIFTKVLKKLQDGKFVLFTGTPCQVNALYNFLNHNYDNLYTCDVICHGVPSPLVFNKYLKYMEDNKDSKIVKYNFRDKTFGWKKYNIKIQYEDNNSTLTKFNEDIYMKGFLSDLYLRNSCYNCKCKTDNVMSDITIGDFWGIENKYPEIDDDKGMAAVIINTTKGRKIIDILKDNIFMQPVSLNDIIDGNPSLRKAAKKNKCRDKFFHNINNIDIVKNIHKYYKKSISIESKLKGTVIKIIHKFKVVV
jgi:coenzyme F420-reducing hydrogenase beta subunit